MVTPSTPPLVEVIAGVLAEHQWYDATNELDGLRFGCACLIDDEGNETALLTETPSAHQARAVLAAISEAAVGFVALGPDNLGGVEFVDCMPTIAPNIESARSEIADWYADATPYALIPWTAVEG